MRGQGRAYRRALAVARLLTKVDKAECCCTDTNVEDSNAAHMLLVHSESLILLHGAVPQPKQFGHRHCQPCIEPCMLKH